MDHKPGPRAVFGPLNIFGVISLAGIVGPLVLASTDIAAAFSEPEYNLIRDSISSLALTTLGWIQTIGFLAIGLLVEIFVAGLLFNIRGKRGFGFSIGLLVFFGFGLLLIGAFRTDPAGVPHTIEGIIHSIAATTVFWLFPCACLLIAPSLKSDPDWQGLFMYTIGSCIVSLVLLITHLWLPEQLSWFGLYERVLVGVMVVWVEVMAVWLLRLSLRRRTMDGQV